MSHAITPNELTLFCWENETDVPVQPLASLRRYLHTHPFHELFLTIGTHGWQATAQGLMRAHDGDLFFFPARQQHIAVTDPGYQCRGIILYLAETLFAAHEDAGRILASLARQAVEQPRIALSPTGRAHVTAQFHRLSQEFGTRAVGYRYAARTAVQEILLAILRDDAGLSLPWAEPQGRERLTEVFYYLHTHYMHQMHVQQVADMAHLSRSQFHVVFKAETGKTLTEYVNSLRLGMAERLLRESDAPIAEIALHCGFTSLSHFYRAFTARFGQPPRAWRIQQ